MFKNFIELNLFLFSGKPIWPTSPSNLIPWGC